MPIIMADDEEPMEVDQPQEEKEEPLGVDPPPTQLMWQNGIVPGLPSVRPQHRYRRSAHRAPCPQHNLHPHNSLREAIH